MMRGNDVCGGMVKTCQILVSVLKKICPSVFRLKGL